MFCRDNINNRNSRADIIRLVALACLIIVHFILRNELYQCEVRGLPWILICMVRSIGMCCIPLFLMLTGYLMGGKTYEKGYYKKITRTLVIYFMASIVIWIYKVMALEESINVHGFLTKVLKFEGSPYAWYVEMYIGLFLLSPFLNYMYNALSSEGKRNLVITMLVLTAAPSFFNVYKGLDISWWRAPCGNGDYHKIIPSWWTNLYPMTYYFLGVWIKEKKTKVNAVINSVLIVLAIFLFGMYNFWRSRGSIFIWGEWQDWGSWMNLVLGSLIFIRIVSMKETENVALKKALKVLSEAAFGAYLLSWIPETIIYNLLMAREPIIVKRIMYYPLVIVVYVAALTLSLGMSGIYDLLKRAYQRIRRGAK